MARAVTISAAPIPRRISSRHSGAPSFLTTSPFETWEEEGARDTVALARERVTKLLNDYQKPAIDPAVEEALNE